ncbi:MAG: DegT/DnrJ/EryC1/StrS family aminotransferase [Pirellulales bacterium]|nr:DegT/DnrJ/EryC1/StrS family aminotransferase [Pirellulales bacterium]
MSKGRRREGRGRHGATFSGGCCSSCDNLEAKEYVNVSTSTRKPSDSRRDFLKKGGAVAAGLYVAGAMGLPASAAKLEPLAINGGKKTVTIKPDTRWPRFTEEDAAEVGRLILKPNYAPIDKLEAAWKKHFGCPYAKAHFNGTSSLGASLFALDLPPGSEILVASYSTWFPLSPARLLGLVPRFVDIDPKTFNISVEDCKRRLTSKTRAIMPVHMWGLPCEMDHVNTFAKEHGLAVIEDASHVHGAKIQGIPTGNWGRVAGFSFQATKPLPAIEGGIAVFKNRLDYERATTFGHYKLPGTFPKDSPYRKYDKTAFGWKLRMHPASAILAMSQLKQLDENNRIINGQVRKVNDRITQLPGLSEPVCRPDMDRVYYWGNPLFLDEKKAGMTRAQVVRALKAEGVDASVFEWTLVHTFPFFREAKWWNHAPADPGELPGSKRANATAILLPKWNAEQPELCEQYAQAFEKVWAHRDKLGKA